MKEVKSGDRTEFDCLVERAKDRLNCEKKKKKKKYEKCRKYERVYYLDCNRVAIKARSKKKVYKREVTTKD